MRQNTELAGERGNAFGLEPFAYHVDEPLLVSMFPLSSSLSAWASERQGVSVDSQRGAWTARGQLGR